MCPCVLLHTYPLSLSLSLSLTLRLRLSAINQDSQAIMTSVSLRVDPEEGEEPGSHGDSTVVFDSSTLPFVSLK